jgi:hypothetical protein
MATPKEEPLVEILSTFDMTKIIWTLKKKTTFHVHILGNCFSNIAKTFLQVSIGYRIRNVVGDFCLNPNIKNHHFNTLI